MADFLRAGLRPSDWWREAVCPSAEQIETITELKRLTAWKQGSPWRRTSGSV